MTSLANVQQLYDLCDDFCKKIEKAMDKEKLKAKTVTVVYKTIDFDRRSKSITLSKYDNPLYGY